MAVPEGAQRSEDGQWWWDGANWQAVDEPQASTTAVGQLSEDGQWQWDGAEWQAAGGPAAEVDLSGLIETLNVIAELDEVAAASTSSTELDTWLQSLTEWQDHLSQQGNIA
jgi:hypothetical protein